MALEVSATPEQGSAQGANRTTVINSVSPIPRSAVQNFADQGPSVGELGGSRSPADIVQVGGNEVNSGDAGQIQAPPEIGKGSIADIFI